MDSNQVYVPRVYVGSSCGTDVVTEDAVNLDEDKFGRDALCVVWSFKIHTGKRRD